MDPIRLDCADVGFREEGIRKTDSESTVAVRKELSFR